MRLYVDRNKQLWGYSRDYKFQSFQNNWKCWYSLQIFKLGNLRKKDKRYSYWYQQRLWWTLISSHGLYASIMIWLYYQVCMPIIFIHGYVASAPDVKPVCLFVLIFLVNVVHQHFPDILRTSNSYCNIVNNPVNTLRLLSIITLSIKTREWMSLLVAAYFRQATLWKKGPTPPFWANGVLDLPIYHIMQP